MRRRAGVFKIAILALCAAAPARVGSSDSGFIRGVRLSSDTLVAGAADGVRIHYVLDREAAATVRIYDANHRAIRSLAAGKPSFPGVNSVAWDGRDDAGQTVPTEAYYFTIACVDREGREALYDPPLFSGGERIDFTVRDLVYDANRKAVVYRLNRPARVQIRAGVFEGPLLKTLADWAPRRAGEQAERWDGKDESGLLEATQMERFNLLGRAYTLPENSIFVNGRSIEGPPSPAPPRTASDEATSAATAALERARRIATALASRERPVDPHVWVTPARAAAPGFQIARAGAGSTASSPGQSPTDAPAVAGDVGIRVTLDETTRLRLQEQRFEIVVYIDGKLIGEQEQGYTPFTYLLDTTKIPNGAHVITINVAGLEDQLSARSLRVTIQNPASR
jgi:hypothetical protein